MSDNSMTEQHNEMKQRFDAYYEDKLLPLLRENDNIRRRYFSMFLILLTMSVFLYPLVIYKVLTEAMSANGSGSSTGIILMASCFVILVLSGPVYFFKKKAKKGIMADFAGFFGTFTYENEVCLPDGIIKSSDIFRDYNEHFGDDYFSGTYKDVQITVSEETLKTVKTTVENNKVKIKRSTVFDGICVLLEMNKNFKGRTVVLKDRKLLNVFTKIPGLQRIRLEDSKFEDIFEVYGSDQIEARYLLTTAFMERMLKLRDLFGGKSIQFSFNENKLLVAVPTRQNMFEACSFFRSNVNRKKIERVFEQFYQVFSIVDILKLNQKIGM